MSHCSYCAIFSVTLPKPSISMSPVGQITWGHNVSITCSISPEIEQGGTFVLKKTTGSFKETESSNTSSITFNILRVNFDDEGPYQCQFEKSILSKNFSSPLSDPVTGKKIITRFLNLKFCLLVKLIMNLSFRIA